MGGGCRGRVASAGSDRSGLAGAGPGCARRGGAATAPRAGRGPLKPYYDDPSRWLGEFEAAFEAAGLRWAILGGLAALEYRQHSRDTVDLDCVVDKVDGLVDQLRERGLDLRLRRDSDGSPYLVQGTTPDGMHFDVYIAGTPFEESALERRGADGYVSVEDLIVYKLLAGRPEDRDDIGEILAAGHELDTGYIEYWTREWDVLERWHEAISAEGDGGHRRSNDPGAQVAAAVVEAAYPAGVGRSGLPPGPRSGPVPGVVPGPELER